MTFLPQPKPTCRLVQREAEKSARDREARQIRAQVRIRDGFRCRVCGRNVYIDAPPARRAETHHIEPRSLNPARVLDPENMLLVDGSCHRKLTNHEIEIVGTQQATCRFKRGPNFRPGR